jgi:uncharacterized protein YxeA
MLNKQIIYIFIMQILLCIFGSLFGTFWEKMNYESKLSYLEIELDLDPD